MEGRRRVEGEIKCLCLVKAISNDKIQSDRTSFLTSFHLSVTYTIKFVHIIHPHHTRITLKLFVCLIVGWLNSVLVSAKNHADNNSGHDIPFNTWWSFVIIEFVFQTFSILYYYYMNLIFRLALPYRTQTPTTDWVSPPIHLSVPPPTYIYQHKINPYYYFLAILVVNPCYIISSLFSLP